MERINTAGTKGENARTAGESQARDKAALATNDVRTLAELELVLVGGGDGIVCW